MKNLQQYLNEGHTSAYDKTSYENSESHAIYKQYAADYLAALNEGDKLYMCINSAIDRTNQIFDVFYANGISNFLTGQMIGRMIETSLSEKMANLNGFEFKHGKENGSDKDIECCAVPSGFTIDGLDSSKGVFDIELKTSKSNKFTGNKSYAQDADSKKSKNSFYILIKYKLSKELPEDNEQKTKENNFRFKITDFNAYFCYLVQNDWWYGDKGNAASLKTDVLTKKRLIEIPKPSKTNTI